MKIIVNGIMINTDWIIDITPVSIYSIDGSEMGEVGYEFDVRFVNDIDRNFSFFYQDYYEDGSPWNKTSEEDKVAYKLTLEDANRLRDFIISHWSKEALSDIPQIKTKNYDNRRKN